MVDYISWFKNFPPELATVFLAMLPVAELRFALPVALIVYKLPFWSAFFWSVFGNVLPIFFVIYFMRPTAAWLVKHSRLADKFFSWWFNRVRYRFEQGMLKYGINLALVLFVSIPLPMTGAWSGAVASFLFGIPPRRALILITFGVIIAGFVVTALTQGGWYVFNTF